MDDMSVDSEWNEAKAYFFRIHTNLDISNKCSLLKDYVNQLSALFNVHRELSPRMITRKEDLEGEETFVNELAKAEQLYQIASRKVNLWNNGANIQVHIIIRALYDYEIFLRDVMKRRKMDLPRQRDPKKALFDDR